MPPTPRTRSPLAIRDIRFFAATSTVSQRIADATHDISDINFVIAELELENGTIGQGYLLAFHYFPRAIAGALMDVAEFVKNYEVCETVKLAQDFATESEYFGHNGLLKWVLGVVNIAMWDAWGKTNGQPVWKMLGASRADVPVYGSGGWLSYTDDELIDEVTRYQRRGFRAVKIKVGAREEGRDRHRLRIVREALGPDIAIMMDANQGLDVPAALKLANEAAAFDIRWFEEPINHTDFDGYQTLRARTAVSLAMGEREFDCAALKALIARNAIDLWQPDILRLGGVEPWRESAALAHAHHLPVLPHYYKDYDVPLLCTIPNGRGAESFDWIDGLIDNPMQIENGLARPRQGAGWGFSFLPEKLHALTR
ncbi:MAG: mandelate racemase/muconate lactonizing enzyme family protein [Akkermansiaceae bacterium]|jgi:L-alanine-DL-glutamate epimerase-like enolase superfamily enzyme|nr:mandelate racemase/muconate lactonizing enzyme family protein [Akkermansiaceae bacterium]